MKGTEKAMKVIYVSDTHGGHDFVKVPEGDILIHAGDFSGMGREQDVRSFAEWIRKLPHKHKIVIAGNHDVSFARMPELARTWLGDSCTYLENSGVEIEGLKIWGSPHHSFFDNSGTWVFGVRAGQEAEEAWAKIPEGLDILLTHGGPAGILDYDSSGNRTGCNQLLNAVKKVKPKVHVFGHIHEQGGKSEKVGETLFINAAVLDENYRLVRGAMVIE